MTRTRSTKPLAATVVLVVGLAGLVGVLTLAGVPGEFARELASVFNVAESAGFTASVFATVFLVLSQLAFILLWRITPRASSDIKIRLYERATDGSGHTTFVPVVFDGNSAPRYVVTGKTVVEATTSGVPEYVDEGDGPSQAIPSVHRIPDEGESAPPSRTSRRP